MVTMQPCDLGPRQIVLAAIVPNADRAVCLRMSLPEGFLALLSARPVRSVASPNAPARLSSTLNFCMVMDEFIDYIRIRQPLTYWLEEVAGFLIELASLGGKSPCLVVSERLSELGYSSRCLVLNHSAFLKNTRERVFLFGCRAAAGGLAGAQDIESIIIDVMSHVERFAALRGGPFGVWDIVDPMGLQEQRRRRDPTALPLKKYM